jgi:hypothetical protein
VYLMTARASWRGALEGFATPTSRPVSWRHRSRHDWARLTAELAFDSMWQLDLPARRNLVADARGIPTGHHEDKHRFR